MTGESDAVSRAISSVLTTIPARATGGRSLGASVGERCVWAEGESAGRRGRTFRPPGTLLNLLGSDPAINAQRRNVHRPLEAAPGRSPPRRSHGKEAA